MKIALIGYMGVGKSTLSDALAKHFHLDNIDLDEYISYENNLSIHEIFAKKGEIFFRKEENRILQNILEVDNIVLSCGGGTPMYYNNMELLLSKTFCIYLYAKPEFLTQRLWTEKEKRPLIKHIVSYESLLNFIKIHLFERQTIYEKAPLKINIEEENIATLIQEIILQSPK